MTQFAWQCPFCGRAATVQDMDVHEGETILCVSNRVGPCILDWCFIVCPNRQCKMFTLQVRLWRAALVDRQYARYERCEGGELYRWRLIPPSDAMVLPAYVPEAIVSDYKEACAIKSLSPKASATLARRCLQGMIRDFWQISKPKLVQEILALKDKVDGTTWQAIDAIRTVGNIGAHMEADINVIVDVDPEEAAILIGLIEMLVKDWYVARHEKEEGVKKVIALGQAKQAQRQGPAAQP